MRFGEKLGWNEVVEVVQGLWQQLVKLQFKGSDVECTYTYTRTCVFDTQLLVYEFILRLINV